MQKTYSHILFDHDGVLVNTEPLYFAATASAAEALGMPLSHQDYSALMARGANVWERGRVQGIPEQHIQDAIARRDRDYQRLLRTNDVTIQGVPTLLKAFAQRFTLAIVTTAKDQDFALIHDDQDGHGLGIVEHMSLILTRSDYVNSKPNPEPYLLALARLGVSPDQALVIEDSERGLRAAIAAGLDCATIYHPFTEGQDFSAATYRLKSLAALGALLLN